MKIESQLRSWCVLYNNILSYNNIIHTISCMINAKTVCRPFQEKNALNFREYEQIPTLQLVARASPQEELT